MKFISEITVSYLQHMGDDKALAAAAKVLEPEAYDLYLSDHEDRSVEGLLNYLMQHRHGTPFEHSALSIFVHAPIFVWREWHRHRIGFCLAGDTQIWADRYDERNGRVLRKLTLSELCARWNNGVVDSIGRVRHLASVKNQTLRVLNEETHLFERGQIKDIYQSGIKELYLLQTKDHRGFSLRATKEHRVLTPDGWAMVGELSANDCVYVSGKRNANEVSVPPSLRRGIGVWTSMQRGKLIRPVDYCYRCDTKFPRELLILDHVTPVVEDLLRALDKTNLRPICSHCHSEKSAEEQKLSERSIVAGSKMVRLRGRPKRVSEEMTYDISMEGPWHNFVANGIVVHNSYNEESARYKKLEPCFYIPPRDRPMIKVENWKPGRPKFLTLDEAAKEGMLKWHPDVIYQDIITEMKEGYQNEYNRYEHQLAKLLDPGLARDNLPVGIYSSCWVTCNPRSIMAFLSLRTHEPESLKVSYPLYEIEVAARKLEEIFKTFWPIAHAAFNKHGRLGP